MTVNGTVARAAAVAVAVGAVAGSTSALLKVAATAELSPAWSLPLALDGAALVAAMAVRRRQGDVLAWAALVAATATSAAVQWLSAPPGLVNHLAHVVPPVAVLVAFELYQRVTAPEPVVAAPLVGAAGPGKSRATFEQPVDHALSESTPRQPERKEEAVGAPADTGPLPAPAPTDAPRRKREPRPTVRRQARQVEADPTVVKKVRAAVHELEVPLDQVTRDDLLKHMRRHGPAPHATKVGAALRHLKEQP